jgi:hypothetical protein
MRETTAVNAPDYDEIEGWSRGNVVPKPVGKLRHHGYAWATKTASAVTATMTASISNIVNNAAMTLKL